MNHKPTIYCSGVAEQKLVEAAKNLPFWSVQNLNPTGADILMQYTSEGVLVKGIEQSFPLDADLHNILSKISPLNLTYIEQLFDAQDEQMDMLRLAKRELVDNLDILILAMAQQDEEKVKFMAHKLISKLLVLSIPAQEACHYLENHSNDLNSKEVQYNYYLLKMYCLICLWQIQDI